MGGFLLPRTSVSARKSHCTFFFTREVSTVTYFRIWIRQWGVRINTEGFEITRSGRMAELYCNLAIKVQLILKMQLICSLLKNLSFKIIRRLASLLPGKTRRQSSITMLYFFFFGGKKKSGKKIALTIWLQVFCHFPHHPRERWRAKEREHRPSDTLLVGGDFH